MGQFPSVSHFGLNALACSSHHDSNRKRVSSSERSSKMVTFHRAHVGQALESLLVRLGRFRTNIVKLTVKLATGLLLHATTHWTCEDFFSVYHAAVSLHSAAGTHLVEIRPVLGQRSIRNAVG